MHDNIIYRLELTDEQYIFLEQVKKEINGTIYKVNTYFNGQADESVLNTIFRLTKKS